MELLGQVVIPLIRSQVKNKGKLVRIIPLKDVVIPLIRSQVKNYIRVMKAVMRYACRNPFNQVTSKKSLSPVSI